MQILGIALLTAGVAQFISPIALATQAPAAPPPVTARPRLSEPAVETLALSAATNAGIDVSKFGHTPPNFDPVTKVWNLRFRAKISPLKRPPLPDSFSVFVYDATSHTETTCLGKFSEGLPIKAAELPKEVRPFVPKGEDALDLQCADLSGDGRSSYVLVTGWSSHTLQILLRTPDGKLSSVVRKDGVLDGSGGDGAFEVIARRGRLQIVNKMIGSGGGDIYTYYFQWSAADGTWLLTRAEKTLEGYAHTDDDHAFVQHPKDFGRVTLGEFDTKPFES